MSYIGVEPKSGFIKADQEKITGQTTNYVNLTNSISSLDDVQIWVNYVIQDPSTLTLNSSTQVGLGDTLVSSDVVLVTYLGQSVATQNPANNSVTNDMLAGSITNSKLATPTTINNNADNRVITGSGTANTLEGESNLTYDGTTFQLSQASPKFKILPTTNGNDGVLEICGRSTDGSPTENRTQIKGEAEGSTANTKMTFHVENASGVNEKMVLSSGGNLGVGIASPETTAHIQSASGECELRLTAASTSDARLRFGDTTTTAGGYIGYNRSTQNMYIRSANSGSAHVSIQDTGRRVAIGVDSPDDVRLHVKSSDQACIKTERTSTSNNSHLAFKNPNGGVGEIVTNGSATSYLTSSDYRLKENEVSISDGIDRLKQLKPYRFNFKADADTTVDGFFAHEVSSIVPEAISGEKDAVDSEGNPEYQGIDQAKLVPLLTSALQEAITKIETLEARVKTLEDA